MHAGIADRSRIVSAVPGVDHNDFSGVLLTGLRRRINGRLHAAGQRKAFVAVGIVDARLLSELAFGSDGHVNCQPPFESGLRRQHENLFDHHRLEQVENYAGFAVMNITHPHPADQIVFVFGLFQRFADIDVFGIHHQTFRPVKQKNVIVEFGVGVKHDTHAADALPDPQPADAAGGIGSESAQENRRQHHHRQHQYSAAACRRYVVQYAHYRFCSTIVLAIINATYYQSVKKEKEKNEISYCNFTSAGILSIAAGCLFNRHGDVYDLTTKCFLGSPRIGCRRFSR